MYWDRFDIVEAWYLALTHCHGGQHTDAYGKLCVMQHYFTPSPLLSVDTLNDNARAIYDGACDQLLNQ